MASSTQDMFEVTCLVENINIKLCARIESGTKQLLALVTSNDDIVLHYLYGESPAVLKRIPWYISRYRVIQAICFDPTATWLLVVCVDGSLHIIPFLGLVDKKQKIDCKWSVTDLTHFPKPPNTPDCKPTSVVWWQTLDSNQNGLIGYEDGTIALISLTDGRCLAACSVNESITCLNLCQDNSLNAIFLLINGISGQQWKHILEQPSAGYVWPPELTSQSDGSALSKLLSLKQMGVDKLASLVQRLIEGKTNKKDNGSDTTSESSLQSENTSNGPELLPHLCDTYFSPQNARDRYLFSAFYKPASLLTVHAVDIEAAPLYTHKLPPGTDDLLLTDKLIFTLNSDRNILKIVSSHLSECRIDGSSEFNLDSMVAEFPIEKGKVLKLYKLSDISPVKLRKPKDDTEENIFEMPKSVDDLDIRESRVDTCILVTNKAVYKIFRSISPIHKFIHYIMEDNDYDKANRLADIFALNVQQLLEGCGDLFLSRGSFQSGIIIYKQAKVHLLKRVLKVAISADCKTILKFVHLCLNASKMDMSLGTKIHIGNLAVMAYTELLLRQGGKERLINTKEFMNFLKYEEFYDHVLAVNVACQARHWKIVHSMAKSRGLEPETVMAVAHILQSAKAPKASNLDFAYLLSELCLTQSILLNPKAATIIFKCIRSSVKIFPKQILRRFILQLDPSQPAAVPIVYRKFQPQKSSVSLDSTLDSNDCENQDKDSTLVKDLIETFIIVLIELISRSKEYKYHLDYLNEIIGPLIYYPGYILNKLPEIHPLSCGYEHAAIIRNDQVYTMGVSSSGCLGLGPLLSQSSPPKLVQTLADLRVKVISVSCGRKHTLFLTDFGVYTCGSNYYGQLGLGIHIQEVPQPQIIMSLTFMRIVEVVCGQYHSMALSNNGDVYTWGWGIHGQLGNGSCNTGFYPKSINFNEKIKQIAAGHAHSLILTANGELYGFGSNAFGQLESTHEGSNKYTKPIRIHIMPSILTPIERISSSYFHNIAVLEDQEVYVWGASPQEVRLFQAKNNQNTNEIAIKPPGSWKTSVNIYSGAEKGPIEQISIGYRHTTILHNGQLLLGKNKDTNLNPPVLRDSHTLSIFNYKFLHISCGFDYTMAIDHIGRLFAWGSSSMAQKILGRALDNTKTEQMVMVSKITKRVLKLPNNNTQDNSEYFPIEVPGIPSMIITYNPTDHQMIFARELIPYAILRNENEKFNCYDAKVPTKETTFADIHYTPTYNIGQKTLHYVLETYHTLYDYDRIQKVCINTENYQAASRIALLGEHYCDSLSFQLKALEKFMSLHRKELQEVCSTYELINQSINQNYNYVDLIKKANIFDDINSTASNSTEQLSSNTPVQILSSSSSLDSIRLWEDQEHQGGCESPCEAGETDDILHNMSQFVRSLKNNQITPPISSVSESISENKSKLKEEDIQIIFKNGNGKTIIEMASTVVYNYIKKIYNSENHILMQNVLLQCIEFWLSNNLPVLILEEILLKNMDKYFYPLSVLLFCKDFSNETDDHIPVEISEKKSARFLKGFSTKFCLQLCLMVVENVNKT